MEDAALFRRVARRCRELATRTEVDSVKEQLRIWAEEFEKRAERVEPGEIQIG
jgi:hypothetical protein